MDKITYALSRKYVDETAIEFGGLKGAPCTIKSIVHQDGQNTVTFEWKNSAGETRESVMVVNDGTPIYVWERGNTYKYGDLVIYASCFYRCITPNSDVVFDSTKWNEIGSPDGNYDIVENSTLLPARFTAADRKMYYSIADGIFWLWDGTRWTEALGTAAQKDSTNVVENSTDLVESRAVYNALATKVNLTSVGVASGIASLNEHGKVPSSELPSYVDDVIEAYYKALDDRFYEESTFETLITPEAGKCWVDIPSNKSYRWSGSVYVRVDEGVQLGETADSAYAGNKGKKNADDIAQIISDMEAIEAQLKPMTGATSTTAGTAGFVVQPQAGDQNKVLKGNGTWGDMEGGHVIVDEDGLTYPQRSNLKITNATITDDAANDTTIVEVEGGGGGGIPLDSPTAISLTNNDMAVIIKWTDPNNKVVDGVTIAEWAGTKIVRKVGSAPTKVTDGVLVLDSKVKNQYQTNGFEDTGLTNGVTYYYGIFPYTTVNTYTYSETRSFTPEAIYPDAINDLALAKGYQSATATFTSVQNASGIRLVYGTHTPTDETDGTYVDGVTSPHIISNLTNGTKYYAKAYTYNPKQRFTASNGAEVTPAPVTITVTSENEEFIGETITVAGNGFTETKTFDNTLELSFEFSVTGTYTVTDSLVGSSQTVTASDFTEYEVEVSLASITVNVSASDLYNVTEAILYKIENGTATQVQRKTITGSTTKFSVNTGSYKVGYDNLNGQSGNGLLINYTNSASKIDDIPAITVSEPTNYDVTPNFVKINYTIGEPLATFLGTVDSMNLEYIAHYVLIQPLDRTGTAKTTGVCAYLDMSTGALSDYGTSFRTYFRYMVDGQTESGRIPCNYPIVNYSDISGSTHDVTLNCGKLHITFADDYIGKTVKVIGKSYNTSVDYVWAEETITANTAVDVYVHTNSEKPFTIQVIDTDGTTVLKSVTGITVASGNTRNIYIVPTVIYGFHQNFSDTNPDTTITYISGTENENYTPMLVNESIGTATAGSWKTFLTDVLKNKPAMVKTDGTLDYWLDPTDYTKKLDGTASDVSNSSYSGAGAFAWIEKFYTKEVYAADGNSRDVYFAFGGKPDNTYYPAGFVDSGDNELDGLWLPMGVANSNNRTVLDGSNRQLSADQKNISYIDGQIKTVSSRGVMFGSPIYMKLIDLLYMLTKSTYLQSKIGVMAERNANINSVIPNGNVSGFKGGTGTTTLKTFHSVFMRLYSTYVFDPYIQFDNGAIKYSYKYDASNVTLLSDKTVQLGDGNWKTSSKLLKIADTMGSLPAGDNGGSGTTGLCDPQVYVSETIYCCFGTNTVYETNKDAVTGPLTLYGQTTINRTLNIFVLMLPPANYTPV